MNKSPSHAAFLKAAEMVENRLANGNLTMARRLVEYFMGYEEKNGKVVPPTVKMHPYNVTQAFHLAHQVVAKAMEMAAKPSCEHANCLDNAYLMAARVFRSGLPGGEQFGKQLAYEFKLHESQIVPRNLSLGEIATRKDFILRAGKLAGCES